MTEASAAQTSAAERRSARFSRIRLHLWWIAATALLLLALYIVLARQLMSMAPDFRGPLQDLLSERFDTPVTIGALRGHMDGMSPVFVFDDVALSPGEGDAAAPLMLDRIELSISPWASLMARSLRLRQLWISGVSLHLVRSEDGDVRFRGLEAFRGDQVDGVDNLKKALEQVYLQRRIVLDDVRARIDWPGMPPLRTEDLSMALVREGDAHQLAVRLSAIDHPFELDLRLHLRSDVYALSDIDGSAYVQLRGENLQYWLPEQWPLPLEPVSASGQVEIWGELREGEVESADVLLATRDVTLRHREVGESWALDSLNASLAVRRESGGYALVLDEVRARTDNAGSLRAGPLALRWDGRRSDDTRWAMRAEQINATRLREQMEAWPFPLPDDVRALRERLVALAPSGELASLYIAGRGIRVDQFSSRFRDLAVAAEDEQPGVQGLSGWLAGTPDSGVVNLVSPALVLEMGTFFETPMAVSAGGALRWQREVPPVLHADTDTDTDADTDAASSDSAGSLIVQSGLLQASNADATAQAMLELTMMPQQVPRLRLLGELTQGEASRASQYIPLERMASPLRDWFVQAFTGGTVERGRFLYEGPVKIDPVRQQDRTFQMSFAVSDFDLRFLPDWPQVEQIRGTVLVDGVTVHARDLSARFLGAEVTGADVEVLGTEPGGVPILHLDGALTGPASALQQLLKDTPVVDALPTELAAWDIRDGELAGDLSLRIPLSDQGPPLEVEAEAAVQGVGLYSSSRGLSATDLAGSGRFSLARGLSFPELTGQLFGAPVTASVGSDARYTTIAATGDVSVPLLRDWLQIQALAPLDGRMAYRASLRLPRREGGSAPRLEVDSDLVGVSVALPPPLGKTAPEPQPMQLALETGETNLLTVSLSSLGSARIEYGDAGLKRGAVRLGERIAGLPPSGLLVDGYTPVLDLAGWLGVLLGPDADGGEGDEQKVALPPLRLAIETDQLLLLNEPLGPASFSARQNDDDWELALFSEALVGEVRVPGGYTLRGDRPMDVDIERLRWPLTPAGNGERADGSAAQRVVDVALELAGDGAGQFVSGLVLQPSPANMPVANLRLADITVHGRHFGQWQAQLRPRDNGFTATGVRGRWRETSVTGNLDWDEDDNGVQHTRFVGSFDSGESADVLSLFDLASFLESRDASGTLDVGWQGSPLDFDYRQLQGSVSLDVRDALLPSADRRTSALRLLGLVNVGHTLSRRLRLDFSDVVSQGLLTDSIRGSFSLDGAQIDTDNLRIRSPSAEFLIAGGLNLEAQTMDYDIEVTLPLSSNLYAGCLAGPAACAGIFVVERLWGDRLEKMTSMDYRVSGDWDDARVDERGP